MEPCPRISHLQLDDRSRAAVQRLRDIEQLSNSLAVTLGINPLIGIFSKPFEVSYDIATYDWGMWCAAMRAIPEIARERVRLEAELQIIDHIDDPKQQQFWRAIEAGCQLQASQIDRTAPVTPRARRARTL